MTTSLATPNVKDLPHVAIDANGDSHSSQTCPKFVFPSAGLVDVAKGGWLCPTCIEVDEPRYHDDPTPEVARPRQTGTGAGRGQGQTVLPPTDKQLAFVRRLLSERTGNPAAEGLRTALNNAREAGNLSRRLVSSTIDALLAIEVARQAPQAQVARQALPEVAEGHYAIEVDGVVKFYRVDRPTEGKWAGFTFVKVQASDDFYPVKGEGRRPILEAIAADVEAASKRYGHELGRCGVCNRTLTDEESRANGIGPVCAAKMGW